MRRQYVRPPCAYNMRHEANDFEGLTGPTCRSAGRVVLAGYLRDMICWREAMHSTVQEATRQLYLKSTHEQS